MRRLEIPPTELAGRGIGEIIRTVALHLAREGDRLVEIYLPPDDYSHAEQMAFCGLTNDWRYDANGMALRILGTWVLIKLRTEPGRAATAISRSFKHETVDTYEVELS